jgi:hypothetical protein
VEEGREEKGFTTEAAEASRGHGESTQRKRRCRSMDEHPQEGGVTLGNAQGEKPPLQRSVEREKGGYN